MTASRVAGAGEIKIVGPDEVKLSISPAPNRYCVVIIPPSQHVATDYQLWRLHNRALFATGEIQFQLLALESFDPEKAAFREPVAVDFRWPILPEIPAGAWTDSIPFVRAEGDQVHVWHHEGAPTLPWPNGNDEAIRRWRLSLRVIGLSEAWPMKLDLRWETRTGQFEICDVSGNTTSITKSGEPPSAADNMSISTDRPSSPEQARAELDSLARRHLVSVRECFRSYRIEIGAQEWPPFYVGENRRYVGCFAALIDALVSAHLEFGYTADRLCPAVFACIAKAVAEPAFDTSRGPDYVVLVAVVDLCANGIGNGAVGDEVGAVGLRLIHSGIVHGQFNQFLNLAGDRPPFGQSDIAGLGLVGVAFPVRPNRNDVLALFHWAVDGGVKYAMPLVHEHLAERRLIVALVGPNQPVFDCSLDHATLPASSA